MRVVVSSNAFVHHCFVLITPRQKSSVSSARFVYCLCVETLRLTDAKWGELEKALRGINTKIKFQNWKCFDIKMNETVRIVRIFDLNEHLMIYFSIFLIKLIDKHFFLKYQIQINYDAFHKFW